MSVLDLTLGAKQDLIYKTNNTLAFTLDVTNSDGTNFDFTGYSAKLKIYDYSKRNTLLEFTSEVTISGKRISVNLPANSIGLAVGKYFYELQAIAGSNIYSFLYGDFNRTLF